jgi:hypothetical protein
LPYGQHSSPVSQSFKVRHERVEQVSSVWHVELMPSVQHIEPAPQSSGPSQRTFVQSPGAVHMSPPGPVAAQHTWPAVHTRVPHIVPPPPASATAPESVPVIPESVPAIPESVPVDPESIPPPASAGGAVDPPQATSPMHTSKDANFDFMRRG